MLAEAHDSLRGLQEQLSQERQLRKEEAESFNQKMVQVGGVLSRMQFSLLLPVPTLILSSLFLGGGVDVGQEEAGYSLQMCPAQK